MGALFIYFLIPINEEIIIRVIKTGTPTILPYFVYRYTGIEGINVDFGSYLRKQ